MTIRWGNADLNVDNDMNGGIIYVTVYQLAYFHEEYVGGYMPPQLMFVRVWLPFCNKI